MKAKILLCGLIANISAFAAEPAKIPLALYLMPQSYIGSIVFVQPQLNVTTGIARAGISFLDKRVYTTADGTCGGSITTFTVINSAANPATFIPGQTYSSTDASMHAVNIVVPFAATDFDLFFSIDGISNAGAISQCIRGDQIVCNSDIDCGFGSTINWNLGS